MTWFLFPFPQNGERLNVRLVIIDSLRRGLSNLMKYLLVSSSPPSTLLLLFSNSSSTFFTHLQRDPYPKRLFALSSNLRASSHPPTFLLIQYYQDKSSARQTELHACIEKNLACPLIDKVCVLLEKESDRQLVTSRFPPSDRLSVVSYGSRLTYNGAFHYLNKETPPGSICILANLDIYFDGSLSLVPSVMKKTTSSPPFLCLTRHDELPDGSLRFHLSLAPQSQASRNS